MQECFGSHLNTTSYILVVSYDIPLLILASTSVSVYVWSSLNND